MVKIDPADSWKEEDEAESTVSQALDNLEKDSFEDDRGLTDEKSGSSSRPSVSGGRHAFEERMVRDYLMEWYEETPDDFSLDWSQVEIVVSGRLSRSSGKFRGTPDGEKDELKVSHNVYKDSKEEWEKTARHEAVHAWQWQEHNHVNHGPTFTRWLDPFGISVRADSPASEPKYEIVCPNCGVVDKKHRKCKTVENVGLYHCQKCGSRELSVRQNH